MELCLKVLYYRIIPFRAISRAWGWLTNRHLPVWARQPILGLYARTFSCNLDEALDGDLRNYPCLAEFFRRKLKSDVRPIDPASMVVAPSDGTVLNFGRVTAGLLVYFSIFQFFIYLFIYFCYLSISVVNRHDGTSQGR